MLQRTRVYVFFVLCLCVSSVCTTRVLSPPEYIFGMFSAPDSVRVFFYFVFHQRVCAHAEPPPTPYTHPIRRFLGYGERTSLCACVVLFCLRILLTASKTGKRWC
ncbi:unnamed protein product [Pylaiella littoralis]